MESEQKFATFISRASKGRRIGAILSWVAAAALIIALFVPGFQVKSIYSEKLGKYSDVVAELTKMMLV